MNKKIIFIVIDIILVISALILSVGYFQKAFSAGFDMKYESLIEEQKK